MEMVEEWASVALQLIRRSEAGLARATWELVDGARQTGISTVKSWRTERLELHRPMTVAAARGFELNTRNPRHLPT